MQNETLIADRRRYDRSRELGQKGWYHSLELPDGRIIDGVISLAQLKARLDLFGIPKNLTGKRVLDIGAWDGWFSFEMERRGAEVLAVDCVDVENFRYAHKLMGSKVRYEVMDLFDLCPENVGRFDLVLFLGVLYHLKHPLLGLQMVCKLTKEMAIVESFVVDSEPGNPPTGLPYMEFYETDELGGQLDNWFGPNVDCLLGLCRSAGFPRVELRGVNDHRACVNCYRHWEPEPAGLQQLALSLGEVRNCRDWGINFDTRRDEYVACVFEADEKGLSRHDLCVQVGEYGTPAVWLGSAQPNRWQVNCPLPPGLTHGWHDVRVRTRQAPFSNALRIAVDVPAQTRELVVTDICDGITWERRQVRSSGDGYLTFWISGLPENADCGNIEVYLGAARLPVHFVSVPDAPGVRQVNAKLTRLVEDGNHEFYVKVGGTRSESFNVAVRP